MNLSKMNWSNILGMIVLLATANYLYNKFQLYQTTQDRKDDLNIIKKYLLGNTTGENQINDLHNSNKPILWIHIEYSKNARNWCSFGSRTSMELNMPYIYLTLQSIIKHCGADFNVCIVDDYSFKKLLPDYTTDLQKVADPIRQHLRTEALLKVLHMYGGVLMENSFVCMRSIKPQYDLVESSGKPMIGEFAFTKYSDSMEDFMPSMRFIGCVKECPIIGELIEYMTVYRSDGLEFSSAEQEFGGGLEKHLFFLAQTGKMRLVDGYILGTKSRNISDNSTDDKIDIEDILTASHDLRLSPDALMFYIPREEILERNKYNWVVRMSPDQISESNTNLGKYLSMSL